MLFNSLPFFIFFAFYLPLHLATPFRFRVGLILVGSTLFYAYWKPEYVFLPWALIAICFGMTWWQQAESLTAKKWRLRLFIVLLLLPLIFFKYINFLSRLFTGHEEPLLKMSLPLGISFITFTLISHLIDTSRGVIRTEKRFSFFSAAILFFPHLIAGPIVRPYQLVRQFDRGINWLKGRALLGCLMFAWGLFKKTSLADPLSVVVEMVYAKPVELTCWDYLLGIYGFTFQIYFDFSAYTDMALGLGYLLGIRLPTNFDRPYLSYNLVDFWRRWHMTLSFWFRDYVYIPLGGNRGNALFQTRNALITMGLAGLWHGANWTFLFWGLLHGSGISLLHLKDRLLGRQRHLPKFLAQILTFHFVTLGWIAFRSPDLATMVRMIQGPFKAAGELRTDWFTTHAFVLVVLILSPLLVHFDSQPHLRLLVQRLKKQYIFVILAILVALSLALGAGNQSEFIYFEF